uniref:Uncharacterized protein n=1 Tax=Anguilla anguilla TaxID=7936 RepID=A0A0E9T8L3_ANGAN
MPAFRGKLSL